MQNRKLDLDAHFFDQWRSWLATDHGMMETDTGYAVSSLLLIGRTTYGMERIRKRSAIGC